MAQETSVVFDIGSQISKVGFGGETFPRSVFPTVTGRFRQTGLFDGLPMVYCGNEAIKARGVSNTTWPVQGGRIMDWDEMERLWHYIFYKDLAVPPEETYVLHAMHPLVSGADKERMAEIFFEVFAVKGLSLVTSPVLTLYSTGRTTGVALDIGHTSCVAVPVFEGFPIKNAAVSTPLNGNLITQRLQKLLQETGYSFTTAVDVDIVNKIKEEQCFVAKNYQQALDLGTYTGQGRSEYKLPDGQVLYLGEERFRCSEVLFDPALEHLDCYNLQEMICHSVCMTDLDYRAQFYKNLVVTGGGSMLTGLTERLEAELASKMSGDDYIGCVTALPARQHQVWVGGAMAATLSSLRGLYMTAAQYDDRGKEQVHYNFF